MKWIKCSDRLPKNEETVLIYFKNPKLSEGFIGQGIYTIDGDKTWMILNINHNKYTREYITHWMLPEPPDAD